MQNTDPVYGGDTITNLNLTEENRRLLHKVIQLDAKLAAAQSREAELLVALNKYSEDETLCAWQKQINELLADNARLREALDYLKTEKVDYMIRNKLGDPYAEHGTMLAVEALSTTPAQSLAKYHNEVLEKAAKKMDQLLQEWIGTSSANDDYRHAYKHSSQVIRAMKEPE